MGDSCSHVSDTIRVTGTNHRDRHRRDAEPKGIAMQTILDLQRPPAPGAPAIGAGRWPTTAMTPDSALLVFRTHGGAMLADEVVERLRPHRNQALSSLARWITGREVLSVDVHHELWLPLFQFDLGDGSIRPEASQVFTTLTPAFDAWELASWFVEPNAWLNGDTPLRKLPLDARSVLQAARTDRFVALG
jgi:hypothetical protein